MDRKKAGYAPLEGLPIFVSAPEVSPFQTASLTEARMKVQHTAPVDP
jgi:hypothetical protein